MRTISLMLGAASALAFAAAANAQAITIATVNNGDMIRMQGLTSEFNAAHPDITVNWVTLEENILRERVTTDIATGGGQYDVMTIGNYEVPIWAKQGWLSPLEFGEGYDVDDLLPAIRGGLTVEDKLYAAPFYGESAMIMYRTDLFEKAGLTMPEKPGLDLHRRRRAQDHRPRQRHQRHLPARQGRVGREHGLPHRAQQLVRRQVVRRELGAAVRPAGLEGVAAVLRRPDEGRRSRRAPRRTASTRT